MYCLRLYFMSLQLLKSDSSDNMSLPWLNNIYNHRWTPSLHNSRACCAISAISGDPRLVWTGRQRASSQRRITVTCSWPGRCTFGEAWPPPSRGIITDRPLEARGRVLQWGQRSRPSAVWAASEPFLGKDWRTCFVGLCSDQVRYN